MVLIPLFCHWKSCFFFKDLICRRPFKVHWSTSKNYVFSSKKPIHIQKKYAPWKCTRRCHFITSFNRFLAAALWINPFLWLTLYSFLAFRVLYSWLGEHKNIGFLEEKSCNLRWDACLLVIQFQTYQTWCDSFWLQVTYFFVSIPEWLKILESLLWTS